MLTVAIVGMGWWGRRIHEDLRHSEVLDVVAVVEPDAGVRAGLGDVGVPCLESLEGTLQLDDVAGVILTSPHKAHARQVVAVAESGRHVFCEKPFTPTLAEAEVALAAANAAGVVVGIGHERRFEPAVAELLATVRAGGLGIPLLVEGSFNQEKFWNLPPGNWRLSPVEAPVGPLSATGIHLVDLSVAMLGRPTEAWARLRTDIPPFANGAALAVGLGFAGGGSALISAVLATPFSMRLCFYGTEGWVEIRDRSHPESPTGWDVTSRMRDDTEVASRFYEAYPAVRANLEAWAQACLGGDSYPVDHDQIRNNVRAFEAISEAAIHGGLVRLPV